MIWHVGDKVWACESASDRGGDLDQVRAIAWALDPLYQTIDLAAAFEGLRQGRGISGALALPRFIVGIGRKRIEMAKAIREWSGGRTRLVHIGRLRGPLDELDYLITTPAYPTAPSPKVLCLDIALSDRIRRLTSNGRRSAAPPRWINVFLGNPLHGEAAAPARLHALACHLDRLAARYDRDLLICGGPRTRPELYGMLSAALLSHHEIYRWTPDDPANPFEMMVTGAADSVATGDSISVVSQLVAAGHRTLIFPWQQKRSWLAGALATFRPGAGKPRAKDVAAFGARLSRRQLTAELDDDADFGIVTPQPGLQEELFRRLRAFLR